jgi:hypothetical protein
MGICSNIEMNVDKQNVRVWNGFNWFGIQWYSPMAAYYKHSTEPFYFMTDRAFLDKLIYFQFLEED